jgi:hypothetical protein
MRKIVIRVHGHGTAQHADERMAWLPEKIDYGLVKSAAAALKPEKISLLVPHGITINGISTSSPRLHVTRDASAKPSDDTGGDRREISFEVTLSAPVPRTWDERVVIETSSADVPSIVIPVVGELR